jgi:hypothetical protein
MKSLQCEYDDCVVLVRALRNWSGRCRPTDSERLKVEIRQLVDLVERAGPRDAVFHSRLEAARSLIVLGRLLDALNCIDTLLRPAQTGKPTGIR